LYVDYLEEKARAKLASVLASTSPSGQCPTGTPLEDCVLPFLPFTTINLTELAKWSASNTNVLTVNSQNQLGTIPDQPSGGRTLGTGLGDANNNSSVRVSSSGVAASSVIAGGVDPTDVSVLGTDSQPFHVGAIVATGDHFDVRISGGGLNPFVSYTILADSGPCVKPADFRCPTNTILTSATGSIQLTHYWSENLTTKSMTVATGGMVDGVQCTISANGNKAFDAPGSYSVNNFPTFTNYQVTSASIGAGSGSISTAMPAPSTNEGTANEATAIGFTGLVANSRIDVGFASQGTRNDATVASCTLSYSNSAKTWSLTVATWNKPW
jgi:hypothetical protein